MNKRVASALGRARDVARLKTVVRGAVQGVGFRPFVFRLAIELGLNGWVNNSAEGVFLEVEGARANLESFLSRVLLEKPPRSFIQSLESSWLDPLGYTTFEIRPSLPGGVKTALILPDIATCPECLAEILDPGNRRYLYPFTNCTNCGPRFSIIESLPYDRANTSMKRFTMCPQCQAEYENPRDRRFHAQPNACTVCGPQLELWDCNGSKLSRFGHSGADPAGGNTASLLAKTQEPLRSAAAAVGAGQIVAVKGLGGFQLIAAAGNDEAIQRLRKRKNREEKPFALMFPSLAAVREVCYVSPGEQRLLLSPEAPIVLLERLPNAPGVAIAPQVAPNNPNLGVMLPYTPLHHLLLSALEYAVVATSGNLSDEPICIDEHEALERLKGIADVFLVHNRPIVRHVDDSIVRIMAGREMVLRRARGYAPLPIRVRSAECGVRNEKETGQPPAEKITADPAVATDRGGDPIGHISHSMTGDDDGHQQGNCEPSVTMAHSALRTPPSILGVGGHLKNSIALAVGPQVFISQHIGDLETERAYGAFRRVIGDLQRLYESPAGGLVADAHPEYLSTKFARETGLPCASVQHHVAHVLSCMAENELNPPVLGVAWDGTGYGLDGTVWGGEFFRITDSGYERVAHLRQFRLPGGEQAVKEPRRSALGLLFALFGDAACERAALPPVSAFTSSELATLRTMLGRGLNSPLTSSVGRLFDAAACLLGLRQRVRFEGQAAMELEFLAGAPAAGAYPIDLKGAQPAVLDWRPGIEALLADLEKGIPAPVVSTRFHNMLVEAIIEVAKQIGLERVALSGGCFQNRYLTERTVERLLQEGFRVYWHQRVPPNDGGICLGQVVAGRWWKV